MKQKQLGSTALVISSMGIGLAALGRPGYINLGHHLDLAKGVKEMEFQTHQVLDYAWQAGIRYFDVARSYGQAEQFLGSWLKSRNIPIEDVVVGSKWGYTYTAQWKVDAAIHEVKEHSLKKLEQQWQESLHFLEGYLKLYQIHSATQESGVLENQEILDALFRIKQKGILIGLSLSGPYQKEVLKQAMQIKDANGNRLFDCVQATWNLLEPSVGPVLKEAHDLGIGVIVKEALANGRLTDRNQDPLFREKLDLLCQEANRLKTTVDALALAAVMALPFVDTVLSGAATVNQLRSNLAAQQIVLDSKAEQLLSQIAETAEDYWKKRGEFAWN